MCNVFFLQIVRTRTSTSTRGKVTLEIVTEAPVEGRAVDKVEGLDRGPS